MFLRLFPSTKDPRDQPPLLLRYRSSEFFILFTVSIAIFTDIFLYAVLVPVLPFALETRAGVPLSSVQNWVSILLAVYAAGLLVFAPVWGWVADRTQSRTIPFSAGLVALVATTVMLCVASGIVVIIIGRLLQGISAALVWSVGLAIVSDTVGSKRVGEAMGWVTLGMVLGLFLGPMLGGIAFDRGGYYSVFAMCFGLLAVDCFLRLAMIEKSLARHYVVEVPEGADAMPRVDSEGFSTMDKRDKPVVVPAGRREGAEGERNDDDDGAGGDQLRSTATPTHPPSSQQPAVPTAVPSVQKRFPVLILIRIPRLIAAFYACMVHGILLTSFDAVLPLFVRTTFGWDSLGAGLIFFAICIPSMFEPLVGKAADRFGPRWLASVGFVAAAPVFVLLRFVERNSIEQKVLLCALLALIGFAISLVLPPMMGEITRVVVAIEEENPGVFGEKGAFAQAYALFDMAYATGMIVGPVWAGYVVEGPGWGTMGWSFAILAFCSAVPTFLYADGEFWKRKRRPRQVQDEGNLSNQQQA